MFGFLKRRKMEREACTKIGIELHRQIKSAFDENETETGTRLQSFFTVGYLYSFVTISFTTLGLDGGQAADKHLKYICDGVLPGKLYEIFSRLLAALELAKDLDKKEEIKQFEVGIEAGASDASCFDPWSDTKANNLRKHLVGEKLKYAPLPE